MANVDVTVSARVATLALNKSVDEIQRKITSAGQDAGAAFGTNFAKRADKAIASTTKETDRLTAATERYRQALASGDLERIITAENRLAKAYRDNATQADRAAKSHTNLRTAMNGSAGQARNLTGAIDSVIKKANDLGSSTRFVASGLGMVAAPVAIQGLMDLAKVAVTATQSIAVLPAVVSSAATGFATLKIATSGFGEAIENIRDPEKFAEAIQTLSPAAQQTALSIQNLLPQFDALKNATQDALFAGMGEQVNRLVTEMLPTVQRATTGIADSFNLMAKSAINELLTPANAAQIQTAFTNIATSFRELAPAAGSFVQAFVDLTTTGSSFLPGMAQSISQVAQEFASMIREAQQSGQLEEFMRNGIDAAKQLADAVLMVGDFIYDAFGSNGQQNIQDFNDTLEATRSILDLLSGDTSTLSADIQEEFALMTGFAATFRDAILDIPEALATVGNVAIDMANSVKHGLDWMGQNFTNFMNNILPGEDKTFTPLADIPKLPVGDWAGFTPPAFTPPERTDRTYRDRNGEERRIPAPSNGGAPYNGPFPVPGPPARGGRSGADVGPQVPFSGDPTELLQGYQITGQLYSAAQSVLQARHKRAQEEAELNEVLKSNANDADAITKARNELAQAEQEAYEAELRLTEAKQSATDKQLSAMESTTKSIEGFSVELSRDMGISEGLGGILSNIVKFVASLAAAPLMGPLSAIASTKDPAYGSGLAGMLAAPYVSPSQSYGTAQGYAQQGALTMPFGVPAGGPMNTNAQIGFVDKIAEKFGLDMTSGKRANAMTASGKSWHLSGEAGDFSNGSGNTPQMKAFAEYMSANFAPYIQELIYSAPGFNGNLLNGQPHQYSQGTLDDHRDHVHVAIKDQFKSMFEQMFGSSSDGMGDNYDSMFGPGGTPWSADWNKMAQLEASGNWQANTGNGYYGGLQFLPSSWEAAGGNQFAPRADLATPYQQAMTAEQLLKMQGPGAWPNTFTPGSSGPASSFPQSGGPIDYGPAKSFSEARGWTPNSSGGIGFGGGLMGMATGAGGMALNGLAPGAGMAAEMGIKAASKLIEFAGEQAGHLGNGIMETFGTIGDASISSGWLGRAVGAAAGAGVEIGNVAGKTADQTVQPKGEPNDPSALAQKGGERGQQQGTTNNVWNVSVREEKTAAQMANQLQYESYSSGMR